MNPFKSLYKYFVNSDFRFNVNRQLGVYDCLSDEKFLKKKYFAKFNKKLDLDNPISFNEKMQWLKLYNRNDVYSVMVDKYEAKDFLRKYVDECHIIKTIGVYDDIDDVDFDLLPDSFVIKTTHDSGSVIICKNKMQIDLKKIRKFFKKAIKRQYFKIWREYPYKNVKPRIIVEEYLTEVDSKNVPEYKFFCFNGICKMVLICDGIAHSDDRRNTFYNRNMTEIIPVDSVFPRRLQKVQKPIYYEEMVKISERISNGIPFLRVDFYALKNTYYLGELTFFHNSGYCRFKPEEYDIEFGNMIDLSGVRNK